MQSQFRDEELLFDQAHIPLHVHVTGAAAPATRATVPIEVDIVNLHPQMGFDGASASALKSVYRAQPRIRCGNGGLRCTRKRLSFFER